VTGLAFFSSESFFPLFTFLSNWGHFTAKTLSFYSLDLFRKDRKAGFSAAFLSSRKGAKFLFGVFFLLESSALAPIVVEILLLFSLKSKRLERIAGNSS